MKTSNRSTLEQKLASYDGEDRVESADNVLERYRQDEPQSEPYKSKLPTLDRIIGGLYPGQLIAISGITGQGKTTLTQTFVRNLYEEGVSPLCFSYEMPCEDFLSVFPDSEHRCILMPMKLKENTLTWIEERIIEAKLKYNMKVVFIDHLHYLISMNPQQNASFMIGETVRGLKRLALKHHIVIFLVAHMMKTKPDEEPGLGHIRDSSFVEQEADTVLYVWRYPQDMQITVCKIAKNRKRGVIDSRIPLSLRDGRYCEQGQIQKGPKRDFAKPRSRASLAPVSLKAFLKGGAMIP